MRVFAHSVAVSMFLIWGAPLQAQEVPGCGSLKNAFGPFDYRDPLNRQERLPMVEAFHFTPDVESLRQGASGSVLGDLNYTLRVFPNHHRALSAVARYALNGGQFNYSSQIPSAECYFQRALVFRPDDEAVRVIYANFLFKGGDRENARKQYEEALRLAPASVEINYVSGLFFVEVGELDRAKSLAKVAYDNGYPLPGLKHKIEAAESGKSGNRK